jgi:hypothetical protein
MESPIETGVVACAEADGWFSRKLEWVGRKGAPDRLFIKDGRVVFMEFKDDGKECTGQQLNEVVRMKSAGAEIYWNVDSIRYACHLLMCPVLRSLSCFK